MKKNISNILIVFISVCLLIPFTVTIFYNMTTFWMLTLFIDASILGAIILSYIVYYFIETRKNYRRNIIIIIGIVIVSFFLTYGYQLLAADYIFFKQRENSLNEFISQIKDYGKIKEMSDGRRYTKTLNDSLYEFNEKHVLERGYRAKLLSDLLINMDIDADVHRKFRDKLTENDFIGFETFKDGTISFTMDGMLDNCYGFAYSETGEHPKFNDCGTIVIWEKIQGNWYRWGTS